MNQSNFKAKLKERQSLLKGIACAVGGLAVIIGGLFYILVTDLYLLNSSQWLFYGSVCAFGGGLACLLSEGLRHKKAWFYVVKGVGVACVIAFIIIAFAYRGHCDIQGVIKVKGFTTAKVNSIISLVVTVSSIFSFIAIAFQACGITLNVIYGIDD